MRGIMAAILGERTDSQNPSPWLLDWFAGRRTEAGPRVNPKTAMGLSAYFGCLRNISEDIGKLPLKVYRRLKPRGKELAPEHPAYSLLHDAPNADMSAMSFRETLTAHAMGWGGGFAEIPRTGRGQPGGLNLIHPSRVTMGRDADKKLVYDVRSNDLGADVVRLQQHQVFHIHGLGSVGTSGFSLSVLGAQAIGLGLAVEQFGARFFRNDARPGGVLEHPGALKDTAWAHLRESWSEQYAGAEQSHKPAILEEGMKWNTVGIPPEEAQFLETRQFQIEDIARWFRMPPHKIQHLLRATFTNIESQAIEYVGDTLEPWATRWEQEIQRKLFTPAEQNIYFAEHLFKGLLRGDQVKRSIFYGKMFGMGAMSQNDIREAENDNPIGPEGDVYYIPLNMQPAGGDVAIAAEKPKALETRAELASQAIYGVFEQAAARVITKEVKAAERAAGKYAEEPEAFGAWARKFYAEHVGYINEAFTPVAMSCVIMAMGQGNDINLVSSAIRNYTSGYIGKEQARLLAAFDKGEVDEWSQNRLSDGPSQVAQEAVAVTINAIATDC